MRLGRPNTYRDTRGIDRAVESLRNLYGVEKRESVRDQAVHFESNDLPTSRSPSAASGHGRSFFNQAAAPLLPDRYT